MATFSPFGYPCSVILVLSSLIVHRVMASGDQDPTSGFSSLPLDQSNFVIQKPYNVDIAKRYQFKDGVHKLWVYATDKPHSRNSHTNPRTEIRISGYDYSSGVWQFEAYGYAPSKTSGVVIMQIFGGETRATTFMMRLHDGTLSFYRDHVLFTDVYDKWFKLNVIHDVDANKVQIFINNQFKYEAPGQKANSHFFKCGVYAQDDDSDYMESRWKQIKVLKK